MTDQHKHTFAVCINSAGYPASLEAGKIYRVVPDADAAANGLVRIIDESGDAYAYAIDRFYPLDVPAELERALLSAA